MDPERRTQNAVEKGRGIAQAGAMKKILMGGLLVAVLAGCGGCGDARNGASAGAPASSAAATEASANEPTEAQPRLPTLKLWLGPEEMVAELALTGRQTQTGMMFRTNMDENAGMLFVFPRPHQTAFWMKNTFVPLSAAYIDPEGVILEIHPLEPQNTNAVIATSDRVQYVLETPQGWFDRHHLGAGVVIRTERGSLRKTFFQTQ